MSVAFLHHRRYKIPGSPAWWWFAVTAGLIGLGAVYWDDSWHTDRGRDGFLVAPHLLLYGAVTALGMVMAWWAWRSRGDAREGAPRLALLGVATVLVSAPIDELWHRLFGRDAVIWSPPHLVGIAATFTVAVALARGVTIAAGRTVMMVVAANALVLGAAMVLVMEFEADVPQFSPALYLPVVSATASFVLPLIRTQDHRRFAFTYATLAYTAVRLAIVLALALGGFSTPIVPPLLLVAFVVDRASSRGIWALLALPGAVHAVYLPWLFFMPHGVDLTAAEMFVSVLLSLVVAVSPAAWSRIRRVGLPAAGAFIAVVLFASAAGAHDPGQGVQDAAITFEIDVIDSRATIETIVGGEDCERLIPSRIVARRGGDERSAPLTSRSPCGADGTIQLPRRGRWFVYVEYQRSERQLEAWVPIESPNSTLYDVRRLYLPSHRQDTWWRSAVGVALVLAALGLVLRARRVGVATDQPVAAQVLLTDALDQDPRDADRDEA